MAHDIVLGLQDLLNESFLVIAGLLDHLSKCARAPIIACECVLKRSLPDESKFLIDPHHSNS